MIIRRARPRACAWLWGGTDVLPFCDQFGGAVLNATINLHAYPTMEPTSDGRFNFSGR